ncbi:hypothetical protein [Neobacillus mesonae]|uniref:hypothetical protein n=1 Tax=Neobacillus mesonae TaxID=1193713 RepID=UPI00203AE46C|nr:hypothetical protein [Neobacillus mesonae]MCM3568846.1 hypothetical protein [Neobacillus mesonae]
MKITDYYRDAANLNLNGSMAALIPIVLIVAGNLFFLQNQEIIVFTIPFFLYSFLCFQLYLLRKRQSISINRKMVSREYVKNGHTLFSSRHFLVLFLNCQSPKLLFFLPDGQLAGSITKYKANGPFKLNRYRMFHLQNEQDETIGYFKVQGKKQIRIQVFDKAQTYLGCMVKTKDKWRESKEEFLDESGKYIGAVHGSRVFMDEKIINQSNRQVSRLRRGWMPVEWSHLFPEPNTPVLSFEGKLSDQERMLRMSFLINEYFIER